MQRLRSQGGALSASILPTRGLAGAGALLALSVCLAGCGSSSDDDDAPTSFVVETTSQGVAASTPIVIDDQLLAYLADEATTGAGGTDLNGDADKIDSVPVRVNTNSGTEVVIPTAAKTIAFANRTLFLVVDEAQDGVVWNGDADTADEVLLYFRPGDATATFLATLVDGLETPLVAVGNRVYYVAEDAAHPPGGDEQSNLWYADVSTVGAAPDAPVRVNTNANADPSNDGVQVQPLAFDDGILFLSIDESDAQNEDLNGADENDTILALLDTTSVGSEVLPTLLAVDPTADVDARDAGSDFQVAFLVDEAAQGANLNDPALFAGSWQPPQCSAVDDADMTDHVLHWLLYSDFEATQNIVNTGLVGQIGVGEYVYLHGSDFVGVVSYESDEGSGGGCDLNADGDTNDRIFRWVDSSDPSAAVLPVTDEAKMVALPTSLPGSTDSTGGVVAISNLWVIVVDEAQDTKNWNASGNNSDSDTTDQWVLTHIPDNVGQSWNAHHGGAGVPVGVTWMAADPRSTSRFFAAFSETAADDDLNGDGDTLDSVPTFPEKLSGSSLIFPGYAIALSAQNAGLAVANGFGFARFSEAGENVDANGDGDKNDFLLVRMPISVPGSPIKMGTANDLDLPAAVLGAGKAQVGAFLTQEAMNGPAGKDLNGDGDATDLVVRYFQF